MKIVQWRRANIHRKLLNYRYAVSFFSVGYKDEKIMRNKLYAYMVCRQSCTRIQISGPDPIGPTEIATRPANISGFLIRSDPRTIHVE